MHFVDGSPCNNDEAYCYSGECKTYDAQCQMHFLTSEIITSSESMIRPTHFVLHSDKGFDECFNRNVLGDINGNCGSDGTNYIPCHARYAHSAIIKSHCNYSNTCSDVMCGMIYCTPGDYQYVIYDVSIVNVSAYVPSLHQPKRCR